MKTTNKFSIIYITISFALIVAAHLLTLNLSSKNLFGLDKYSAIVLMMDYLVVEFSVTVALIIIIHLVLHKKASYFVLFLVSIYVVLNILQIFSLFISGQYISYIAVENIEFAWMLFNFDNVTAFIVAIVIILVSPLYFSWLIEKKIKPHISWKTLIIVIVSGAIFYHAKYWVSNDITNIRSGLLHQNRLKKLSPLREFIRLFQDNHSTQKVFSWTNNEITQLKKYGFTLNYSHKYPLLKNKIYYGEIPFERKNQENQNVIIIFTEGLSERTTNIHSEKFKDLTANIKDFSKHSLIVENYYNHTAPTYRGLHGQLCSFFPGYGGSGWWTDGITTAPKTKYKCISDVFRNNGYESIYLNAHFKDVSGTDEMMEQLGFDTVLSGEHLISKYLNKEKVINKVGLTDHQLYRALVNILKERKSTNKTPFLLVMYSWETHAWQNINEDGIAYLRGGNGTLNTIYSMDHAFGKFWDFYKNSRYAKDTVIIFTADHAHFHDNSYVNLMAKYGEKNYQDIFVDRIPLLIHAPGLSLPKKFDANYTSSINFAPSLIHLLGFPNERNSFLGKSIFEEDKNRHKGIGISSFGNFFYLINAKKIHLLNETLGTDKYLIHKYIKYSQQLEDKNMIMPYP